MAADGADSSQIFVRSQLAATSLSVAHYHLTVAHRHIKRDFEGWVWDGEDVVHGWCVWCVCSVDLTKMDVTGK